MQKQSLRDITLPSNTPALMNIYPRPLANIETRQLSFGIPRDEVFVSIGSSPLLHLETPTAWSTFPATHTWNRNSPPSVPSHSASTGEAQSTSSAPFAADPASTTLQLGFDKETWDVHTSGALGQSQYQMTIYEMQQGLVLIPVNVQAVSKAADEKRKRNASASHRFRRRRKEKEQETLDNISKLTAEVVYCQLERDFLQDILLENRIPVPPRATSSRRRRHASLRGLQHRDTGRSAPNEGKNTRRRTSEFVPPQWLPPQTVESPPPIPLSSEHI